MTEFPQIDAGVVVLVFNQRDDLIACLNNAMAFLKIVASSRSLQPTINLELPLIRETSPPFKTEGLLCNKFKGGKDKVMLVLAIRTKDLDVYDSECDDVSNAKAVRMSNLSNYGSDVILKVPYFEPNHTDMVNQSVHAM
nr:hypothetical protein [Tanacetum cinerariifolium]